MFYPNNKFILCVIRKGGDFMGIEGKNPERDAAIARAKEVMEWEGGISPRQEVVSDNRKDPTHPLVRGKTRIPTAGQQGQ